MFKHCVLAASIGILMCMSTVFGGDPKPRAFTAENNGQTVRAKPGDTFLVRLSAQMGTGYSWQPREKSSDKMTIQLQKPKAEPQKGESIVGAAEDQIFLVTVTGKGKFRLELNYVRPWVPAEIAKSFRIDVDCR